MATQQEVNAACEAITARVERPTVERVRIELQGGSPNSLTPQVRAWKEGRRQPGAEAPQPAMPVDPVTLPAAIQRALDGLSGAVANLVPAFAAAVAEVAEVERRRSRLEVDAAVARAIAQVDEARLAAEDERAATDAVREEAARHEAAIIAKDQEIKRLTAALADRDQALADRAAEVDRLTIQVGQERAGRTEAGAQIGALTTRLEAAQTTIAELRTQVAVAIQRAEGAEAEAARLRQERAESKAIARDAVAKAAKAEGEIEALRAELAADPDQSESATPKPRRSRPG